MTTIRVCDYCSHKLAMFGLRIRPIMDAWGEGSSGEAVFLDGGWNGGDYCSKECAMAALALIQPPAPSRTNANS